MSKASAAVGVWRRVILPIKRPLSLYSARRPQRWLGILCFWVVCALIGAGSLPFDPFTDDMLSSLPHRIDALVWHGSTWRDFSKGDRRFSRHSNRGSITATMLVSALELDWIALGYLGGLFDAVVGRLLDAFMALPFVILVMMTIVALGPLNFSVILVIALPTRRSIARTVRRQLTNNEISLSRPHDRWRTCIRHHVLRSLPNIRRAIIDRIHAAAGIRFFSVATLSFSAWASSHPH